MCRLNNRLLFLPNRRRKTRKSVDHIDRSISHPLRGRPGAQRPWRGFGVSGFRGRYAPGVRDSNNDFIVANIKTKSFGTLKDSSSLVTESRSDLLTDLSLYVLYLLFTKMNFYITRRKIRQILNSQILKYTRNLLNTVMIGLILVGYIGPILYLIRLNVLRYNKTFS